VEKEISTNFTFTAATEQPFGAEAAIQVGPRVARAQWFRSFRIMKVSASSYLRSSRRWSTHCANRVYPADRSPHLLSNLALGPRVGSWNGRSTVIGLWSEIGSGKQLFRSIRGRAKCGANTYDPFVSRESWILDFTKTQSSLNLAIRTLPQISSVMYVGVNPRSASDSNLPKSRPFRWWFASQHLESRSPFRRQFGTSPNYWRNHAPGWVTRQVCLRTWDQPDIRSLQRFERFWRRYRLGLRQLPICCPSWSRNRSRRSAFTACSPRSSSRTCS